MSLVRWSMHACRTAEQRDNELTGLDPERKDSAEQIPVLQWQVAIQVCLKQGHGPVACVEGKERMQRQAIRLPPFFSCSLAP